MAWVGLKQHTEMQKKQGPGMVEGRMETSQETSEVDWSSRSAGVGL